MNTTSISEISDRSLAYLPSLLSRWLPGGQQAGDEYTVRNPMRKDQRPGSFKINTRKGTWADFASGDSGGDAIDLYKYLNNCDTKTAAAAVAELVGALPAPAAPRRHDDSHWVLVHPVPADAPPLPTDRRLPPAEGSKDWRRYTITHYWPYRDRLGSLLGYVVRYDTPTGKETPPLTLWRAVDGPNSGQLKWRFRGFPEPRPIFNADKVTHFPDAQILVFEGEKKAAIVDDLITANGGQQALVSTCWPGGAQSVTKPDWSILAGRRCILWPDNDTSHTDRSGTVLPINKQPGRACMSKLSDILAGHRAEVRIVDVPATEHPDGWDVADAVIHDGWTFDQILDFIRRRSRPAGDPGDRSASPPDPDTVPAEDIGDPSATNIDDSRSPFRCLGYNNGHYFYLPDCTRQVVSIKGDQHSRGNLLCVAPLTYWERNYMGQQGPAWTLAGDRLMRKCESVGVYDPAKQRGRGAWFDNQRSVLHLGNKLIVDGTATTINDFETRFIYEAAPQLEYTVAKPLQNIEAIKLRQISDMLFWERPIYSAFFAGWCVIAPVCGGLRNRPHIWLTGGAGTGKTAIIDSILVPCLGEIKLHAQSTTSGPGIRQTLGNDALPVLFDEFEANEAHDHARVQGVLELARQAFSDTNGRILKGGQTGRAQSYNVRSCFAMSSITVNLAQHADRTRVMVLGLAMPKDTETQTKEQHWATVCGLMRATFTEDWCAGLRARTISIIPQIRANAETFAVAIASRIGNRRAGDQVGHLLAGAYSLSSTKLISAEGAQKWVDAQDWTEQCAQSSESDERRCLAEILHHRIRTDQGKERAVVELIEDYHAGQPDGIAARTEDQIIGAEAADKLLRRFGIRVVHDDALVYFSDSHPGLKRILDKTPWGNSIARILKRIPGAIGRASMRFIGPPTKATGIPLKEILGEETD